MFSRVAVLSLLAAPLLAAAASSGCSTGPIQCCDSVEKSDSAVVSALLTTLGIDVGSIVGEVGFNCSPLTVIGVGGGNCDAHSVCCENNNVGGAVSVGCLPVDL